MSYDPHVSDPHSLLSRKNLHCNPLFNRILIGVFFVAATLVGLQFVGSVLAKRGDHVDPALPIQNDPMQPFVGPGMPQVGSSAPRSAASSTKAGSLLFFQKFTSNSDRPNQVNTLLTVTNTNPRDFVSVRIFFISDCSVEDQFLTLAANQSRTLVASKENPGKTGYAIAMAVNAQGLPTQFNWLTGKAALRDEEGHQATYNALAVAKRSAGQVNLNDGTATADLVFDGADYDRLPKLIAIDHLQNQDPVSGPAVRTDIALFSPLRDLSGLTPNSFTLKATAYDTSGTAFSQNVNVRCGLNASVSQIWTTTPFNTIIAANRPGWATFAASADTTALPVIGLSLTDGPNQPMHNARVMQTLEWLDTFRITVPLAFPENPVSDVVTQDLPDATGGALGASETKAGSVLIFPRFVSGENGITQIYLTNTHPTDKVRLRVFFTGLADPVAVKEALITVPALQTRILNADEIAPNQRGWVMVVAIDSRALPIQFNRLLGSAQVIEVGGQRASSNALAIAKNSFGAVERNSDLQTAELLFDDLNYDRLPATTAMAFVPSQVDNSTVLGFSRPAASLLEPPNTRGAAMVTLYDDALIAFGANVPRTETRLNQIRPSLLQPPITNTLEPGEQGWLKILTNTPIISWSLNMALTQFSASGGAGPGGWRGGIDGDGNLHILTTADNHGIKVPATNPNNHPPVAIAETIGLQVEARRPNGTIVRLDGSSSSDEDPDDPLTYNWTDGDQSISTARISDRRLGIGTHNIRLVVTDGSGVASLPADQSVTVVDTTPPKISGVPSAIFKVTDSNSGEAINFALPIAYDMVDGNVSVSASNQPGSIFPVGKTVVTFTAIDAAGNRSIATMDVTVTIGTPQPPTGGIVGSKAPVMDNLNDLYVRRGEIRNILLQAVDADGDAVSFTLQGAPPYAQILSGDPGSRTAMLRIAPQLSDTAAATNVRVVVNDGRGQTFTTLPFRIMISDVPNDDTGSGTGANRPPNGVIAQLPRTIQATSKSGVDVTLDASESKDPDGDSLSFSWFDGDTLIARGGRAIVKLAIGAHAIKLVVFDGKDGVVTVGPVPIEVLPRDLSIINATPNRLTRPSAATLTIIGTGFNLSSDVRFGKDGITITKYVSIAEDMIVVTVEVNDKAIPGFRDIFVVNGNGKNARLRSGLFVDP